MSGVPIQGFVGGAYSLPTRQIACQECVNLYVEKVEAADKEVAVLVGTPGMKSFCAQSAIAGHWGSRGGLFTSSTGRLFRLQYDTTTANLIEISAAGAVLSVGGGSPMTAYTPNVAVWADNGTILFPVTGNATTFPIWFNMTTNQGVEQIDATITACAATHIAYLDGFFIINQTGTNKIFASPVDWNGTDAWNALAFASAEQSPDPVNGLIACGRELWVFGPASCQPFYDAGTSPFPLAPNTSVGSNIGLWAKYSLAQAQGSVFWLGSGSEGHGVIYRTVGYTPTRISTHAIEREISSYETSDDAYGFTYQENGHFFYIITFEQANATWCYDLTSGQWHRRTSLNPNTGAPERWRAIAATTFNGKTYVHDRITRNNVYQLDSGTYTDDGTPIVRVRSSPHMFNGLEYMFINRFQLDMQTGVGNTVDPGSDPQMILEYSKDGGQSWSAKIARSMGKIGAYLTRVYWNRLGKARDIVFRVSTSEPVKVTITGAYVDAEV